MKRFAPIAQIILFLGLFVAPAPLAADPIVPQGVIDQAFDPRGNSVAVLQVNVCCGNGNLQTFVAGASGTLSGIEVLINRREGSSPESGLTVSFWAFARPLAQGDELPGLPLVTTTIFPSQIAEGIAWAGVDIFTPSIQIEPGRHYGVMVRTPTDVGTYSWVGGRPGYEPGQNLFWVPGNPFLGGIPSDIDMGFRTYVAGTPNPVPEPASVVLLGLGLGTIFRRRLATGLARAAARLPLPPVAR
jgi:hypothetical protein